MADYGQMARDRRDAVKAELVEELEMIVEGGTLAHLPYLGTDAAEMVSVNVNGIASIRADVLLEILKVANHA